MTQRLNSTRPVEQTQLKVYAVYNTNVLSCACLQVECNLKTYTVCNNKFFSCACLQMQSSMKAYAVYNKNS